MTTSKAATKGSPDKPATKRQVGGDHYKGSGIQPIDFILGNNLGFVEGNVIKYIYRWNKKGGLEDLQKARHYIDILIESVEDAGNGSVQREGTTEATAGESRPVRFPFPRD